MDNDKINQLSSFEQSLSQLLTQRQNFFAQLTEVDSAISESEKSNQVYKIVGNIMVLSNKEDTINDLSSKKKMLEMRISAIEKQEKTIKERAEALQKDILEDMKKK
jgi:prefoldin beta subunit